MFILGFPLLIIPFAIYNIIAFILNSSFSGPFFNVTLLSHAEWTITSGDLIVTLGILLLYVEIMKSTRLSTRALLDHVLSLLLFLAMAFEFMIVPRAGTSTFFLLVALSFVDVIGGFSVAVRSAQRDVTVEERVGA
jgi:hypothetical protein